MRKDEERVVNYYDHMGQRSDLIIVFIKTHLTLSENFSVNWIYSTICINQIVVKIVG